MHWLCWTVLACWLVPVPYLWWGSRRDMVPGHRRWHAGIAALGWPLVLLFAVVWIAAAQGKRWFT